MAASQAKKLREGLAAGQRISDQVQRSFIKAEERLGALEDRDARRAEREDAARASVRRRMRGGA